MREEDFWLRIWGMAALVVCVLIASVTACEGMKIHAVLECKTKECLKALCDSHECLMSFTDKP